MKRHDKITKSYKTKFDYSAKKLGIIGATILGLSLVVGLPIAATISSSNTKIISEIQELHDELRNDNYIIESK